MKLRPRLKKLKFKQIFGSDFALLEAYFCHMLKADAARISSPLKGVMFLVIGFNKVTHGWHDGQGNPIHFDFLQERCVASGDTVGQLVESAKAYKCCQSATWEGVFKAVAAGDKKTLKKFGFDKVAERAGVI
jgi:hypothetical protein